MLEFTEEFFQGEVREDFYIESEMKHAWAAQMEVLMEIDRVCKENDIQYFADYGTLLGAIRHKGFIPWDDDMDICMKREDYNKFLKVAQTSLTEGYFVESAYTSARWKQPIIRVLNGEELEFYRDRMKKFHGCPYIVGVDIFPLDYVPMNEDEKNVLAVLYQNVYAIKGIVQKGEEGKEELEYLLNNVEQYLNIKYDRNGDVIRQTLRLADQLASLYREEECEEIGSLGFMFCQGEKPRSKEWYRDSILMPFENIEIPVPIGYIEVLKALYGDWEKRVKNTAGHDYPFYKKQIEDIKNMVNELLDSLGKAEDRLKRLEEMM